MIAPIELSDEEAILNFLHRSVGEGPGSGFPPQGYLQWLSKGVSVASFPGQMLGWKLTEEDQIRGVHLVTPFRYVSATGDSFHDLVSHDFFVDEECRGMPSLALFQRLLALRSKYRLKATTANAISGKLWRAFGATPAVGSDVEAFQARLSINLLAEGVVRRFPRLEPLLSRAIPPTRSVGVQLDSVVSSIKEIEQLPSVELFACAARLAAKSPPPRLDITEDLLQWVIANPAVPHRVIALRVAGRRSVVVLAIKRRGRWSQMTCIVIQAIWSEGGGWDPMAASLVHEACLHRAHMVSYGCRTRGIRLPEGVKYRSLDGPRRWMVTNPSLQKEDDWVGFDAM